MISMKFLSLRETSEMTVITKNTHTLSLDYEIQKCEPIIDELSLQVVEHNSRLLTQPPSPPDPRTFTFPSKP
jgi:hypothetical protein